jgi:hypoxanthine phosphoribosyltransferase
MSGERQVKILFDERTIAERTEALAREIAAARPKDLLVVAILKGSFMFAADLLRALHRVGLEPQVEFFHLSSYMDGTVSSGTVKILRDIESSVRDRDVVLVDDILESGRTLAFAKDLLMARGARRVLVCTMLEKPGKRVVDGCRPLLSRIAVHRPCRDLAGRHRRSYIGNCRACLRAVFNRSSPWVILPTARLGSANCAPNWRRRGSQVSSFRARTSTRTNMCRPTPSGSDG